MDRDITLEELDQVVFKMKLGKSPGLDGFLVEFYKAFKSCYLIYKSFLHIV